MVKVLLVEDDQHIVGFIKRGLEAEGYVVDVAENGRDALALVQKLRLVEIHRLLMTAAARWIMAAKL